MATLTRDTKVTIGAAIACLTVAISATWWFAVVIGGIQKDFELLSKQQKDAYLLSAASEQALRMAIENPGFRVPDPRDPAKIIVVEQRK